MEAESARRWDRLCQRITVCRNCPRLVAHREEVARRPPRRHRGEQYWARPVPPFGDLWASLLVVGLAPAAHGGNRTGRVFTGDASGDWLFRALHLAGFANQPHSRFRGDGLELQDAYVTAVARCAPPQNRPTSQELANCRPYLVEELEILERVRVVVCLGRVALEGYVRAQRERGRQLPSLAFSHGAEHRPGDGLPVVLPSYHPSRRNTQTGLLSMQMFQAVFDRAREIVNS